MMISRIRKSILVAILIMAISSNLAKVNAAPDLERVNELKTQISSQKNEIAEIEKEIAKYEAEINRTQQEATTLASEVRRLDANSNKLNSEIKLTQKKIEATALNIEKLSIQINDSEDDILNKQVVLAEIIKKIDEADKVTLIELILGEDNISDFFNDLELLNILERGVIDNLGEIRLLKNQLNESKNEHSADKKQTEDLRSELVDQRKLVEINKSEKNNLLNETKNKESNYKKILEEKERIKEEFEKELRDFESQLQIAIDPSSLPPAGQGILSWPLDDIYITQEFGRTVAAQRLYTSGSHNGVDFRARVPTRVLSSADGIVVGAGDTDITCPGASFGRWILIDFQNGLAATYAHLSVIKVSEGDKVSRGQVIGYTGNTGYSTGPHLHMSVYAREGVSVQTRPSKACNGEIYTMPIAPINAYLDPLDYL